MTNIRERAAQGDAAILSVGPFTAFARNNGDAWLLDTEDHYATPIAKEGQRVEIALSETEEGYAIDWPGTYRLESGTFYFTATDTGEESATPAFLPERLLESLGAL